MARDGSKRLRFEVATQPQTAPDTTGAGDAFDAGFLVGWFGAIAAGRALPATMRQAGRRRPPCRGSPAVEPARGARARVAQRVRGRYAAPMASTIGERLVVAPEVAEALRGGRPAVALESTLISHGLPYPQNLEVATASEAAVREAGAVPATVAIRDGRLLVGLEADDLEALANAPMGSVRKAAAPALRSRSLPAAGPRRRSRRR